MALFLYEYLCYAFSMPSSLFMSTSSSLAMDSLDGWVLLGVSVLGVVRFSQYLFWHYSLNVSMDLFCMGLACCGRWPVLCACDGDDLLTLLDTDYQRYSNCSPVDPRGYGGHSMMIGEVLLYWGHNLSPYCYPTNTLNQPPIESSDIGASGGLYSRKYHTRHQLCLP